MPRLVFSIALALFAGAASAATAKTHESTPMKRSLAKAFLVPSLVRADEAAVAVDLASGRAVYAYAPGRSLAPASNEKLAVTYAALKVLGPRYRFRTDVVSDGRRRGSVLEGDVYLRGHGDPTLHTHGLAALARQLRAEGIRTITGRVRADEAWFDTRRAAPGWDESFETTESLPLSALVVNRAMFDGAVSTDPAGAAAAIFTRVLQRAGITVRRGSAWGTAPVGARELARTTSEPLALVLRFMDRWSDNFTAEMLLKTLGAQTTGEGTTAAGARVVTRTLRRAGIPLAGVRIVDGSGLSTLDRLTPRAIAAVLVSAWHTPRLRHPFWRALAVAGRSGTLRNRMVATGAAGLVHGKTGTTHLASALSGYVGRRFAFSVLENGRPVRLAAAHLAQDRFALALSARG